MITTTIATIVIGCGWFAPECDMKVSSQQIYQAYKKCHQGKRKSVAAQKYSAKLLDNIFDTCSVLHSNTYQPKPYHCFVATNGSKPREIFAADFSDRVVHHYLVPQLEKIINAKFIYYSCANQAGKGTHFGVNALQKMMRQQQSSASRIDDQYFLQLDVHNFFYSIDKKILLAILAKHLKGAIKKHQITPEQAKDNYLLSQRILKRGVATNQLSEQQLAKILPHKQLNNVPTNKGLPIGNLTSQFFGNVYLNELDQFVKHQLKVKHFVRFVDDFVLLGSKNKCRHWQQQIEIFLAEKLQLKLKPIQILEPINRGVDFLGYIIYPHYKLVRKRVLNNFYQKLKNWYQDNSIKTKNGVLFHLNVENTTNINSLFASYIGHIKHAKHYKILQNKITQFPWLKLFFYNNKGHYTMTTNNKSATKFTHQHYFFNTIFNNFVVLIQKGNSFIINTFKGSEFNLKHLNATLEKLQSNRQSYVFISEQGYVHNKLKQRKLKQIFITHHFYNKEQNYVH